MNKLCDVNDKRMCSNLASQVKNRAKSLIEHLETMEATKLLRKKRYLLGKILQFVFGVNEEVYDDLDNIHEEEEKLSQHQQKIGNIMLQTEQDKRSNQDVIANHMSNLEINVKEALDKVEMSYIKDSNKINLLYQYETSTWILNSLERKYIQNTKTSRHLLEKAKNVTNTNIKISISGKTTHAWSDKGLTTITEHPLYDAEQFELMKATVIPRIISNKIMAVNLDGIVHKNTLSWSQEEPTKFICWPRILFRQKHIEIASLTK